MENSISFNSSLPKLPTFEEIVESQTETVVNQSALNLTDKIVSDRRQDMAEKAKSSYYEEQSYVPQYTDEQRTEVMSRLDAYLQAEGIDVENPIDPPEYLIEVNGVPAFPIGDITLITGEKKSGKSTTYHVLSSVLLNKECKWGPIVRTLKDPHIVIFDSEQSRYHAQKANQRILRMARLPQKNIYDRMRYVPLRKLTYEGRLKVIEDYLEIYQPNVAIIDGIVDLITDFNSIEESKPFIDKLMAWATHYNCCVIGLIHTSKSMPGEPRGHLGAFGVEKAYMTIETKKASWGIFSVGTQSCRGVDMPEWHFKHEDDIVVPADDEAEAHRIESNNKKSEALKEIAEKAYQQNAEKVCEMLREANYPKKKADLVKLIETTEGLGQKSSAAYNLLKRMEQEGKITPDEHGYITVASE